MQKVLFIQTAFIGDVVLATGLLEAWHKQFPNHTIDILVRKGNETLFHQHPFLGTVLVWNKQQHKYKNLLKLLVDIRKKKYHTVINVQRFAATGLLAGLSKAPTIVGFQKNPFSFLFTHKIAHIISQPNEDIVHEVERNHLLIQPFVHTTVGLPKLYPTSTDYETVEPYKNQPYICIAPSSVWFTKQFPLEKWVDFIHVLPANYTVYLLGGKTDATFCNNILEQCTHKKVKNLAGTLSFLQSAALQKNAVMNFVNDSAPLHFASAVNAAVTAVYCSTIPAFGFGPLSTVSYTVQSTTPLSCKPCGLHGKKACPLQHFNCANTITNAQLLSILPQ